jgi:helicase
MPLPNSFAIDGRRFLAAFIGVDRFADPTIRDLSGCRRDAIALWALFSDTFADIQSARLIDEQATLQNVRAALESTLGTAGPDDIVVISFSGHGSADHRLILHDTDRNRYADTTLDMGELAARFKASQAGIVICILDCCFSGGAPARVLDDTPATRSPGIPLDAIAGAGRIIIAASNVDQPALESGRHGLLTRALFEALQSDSEFVSLPTLMDGVMQRVRAEAERLGHIQTPVVLGSIEGGLRLPSLRRGPRFFAAFPEATGVRVSQRISDLAAFGLPAPLLNAWSSMYPEGLNELQLTTVNERRILDGRSLFVVAPTSSGKTFVGEIAAAKAVVDQRKAVFLFPYKALVNEKFDQFTRLYHDTLGMRVIRCTGDYLDQTESFIRGKYDLAVLTYEMFLNLTLNFPATLNLLGLVVVDEAQFISNPHRGIIVELLLTNLLTARQRGVFPQVIALSAVVGDLNGFDEWLACERLVTSRRPVPLVEGVMDRQGVFQFVDTDGTEKITQLLAPNVIVQRKSKPEKQDLIVPLVRALLDGNANERVIVFRNRRGPAKGCAEYLANELKLPPAQDIIELLPSTDLSAASTALRRCLSGGTAFHNADLGREERAAIEAAFRERNGRIRVLGATTTVAAGINTPASIVLLAEQEFIGEENQPFTVAEYKNMAGRAGRVGYNEQGRSIILAETSLNRENLFRKYVLGTPEPMSSSFDRQHTETWLLRLLAQVKRVPRAEVIGLLAATYGGYLASRSDPSWHDHTVLRLTHLLDQMLGLELIEEEGGFIRLTLLGRACGSSSLSFPSAMRLVQLLRTTSPSALTAEALMVLLQALPELDATYTPVNKRGQLESRWSHAVAQTFGSHLAKALQRNVDSDGEYAARCKRVIILHRYIAGSPMEDIEKEATTNPFFAVGSGHVRQFADASRFHLRAAHRIATALLLQGQLTDESVDQLLRQLETGLPADTLDLLRLPVQLGRGEYLVLRAEGVRTAEAFWALSPERVEELLGKPRAVQLERFRP